MIKNANLLGLKKSIEELFYEQKLEELELLASTAGKFFVLQYITFILGFLFYFLHVIIKSNPEFIDFVLKLIKG
jgi:hypothetical protein